MKHGKNHAQFCESLLGNGDHISPLRAIAYAFFFARVWQLTISRHSRRIFRCDNAFDKPFSNISCLCAEDLHCNHWCSIMYLGAVPWEILIDMLAFWANGNGPYASILDWQKMRASHPCMQVVSQLSLSQAPHGFPTFLASSNCLKTAKLCRLTARGYHHWFLQAGKNFWTEPPYNKNFPQDGEPAGKQNHPHGWSIC